MRGLLEECKRAVLAWRPGCRFGRAVTMDPRDPGASSVALLAAATLTAENWPQFRGPFASGLADGAKTVADFDLAGFPAVIDSPFYNQPAPDTAADLLGRADEAGAAIARRTFRVGWAGSASAVTL